eukprot:TRINITY_DN23931_c0_g3_i1.p1 TRINITY_DN23931_c0_g3~~TRINITY_DN23931_c0_g3_i1.p1  ORF type:complete len:435 (-),score=145.24 TRINITY_DN23931_c0_g3_i1:156-1460(-)
MPTDAAVVNALPFNEDKKAYVLRTLDPVLECMVADVLGDHPAKPLDYMIKWLRKHSGRTGEEASTISVVALNKQLKQEMSRHSSNIQEANNACRVSMGGSKESVGARSSSAASVVGELDGDGLAEARDTVTATAMNEDKKEEGATEGIPKLMEAQLQRKRYAVSAYPGNSQGKRDSPSHATHTAKTDEQTKWLLQAFKKVSTLQALDASTLQALASAAEEVAPYAGEEVQTARTEPNTILFVQTGMLEIRREDGAISLCKKGDVANEQLFLHRAPVGARIVAKKATTCWQMQYQEVQDIIVDGQEKRRARQDIFLKKLSLFASLSPVQRQEVVDILQVEHYLRGDQIFEEKEESSKAYFIEDGIFYETQKSLDCETPRRIMEYQAGDTVGEMTILTAQVRTTSVICISETATVLSLCRYAFEAKLGSLQAIMNS